MFQGFPTSLSYCEFCLKRFFQWPRKVFAAEYILRWNFSWKGFPCTYCRISNYINLYITSLLGFWGNFSSSLCSSPTHPTKSSAFFIHRMPALRLIALVSWSAREWIGKTYHTWVTWAHGCCSMAGSSRTATWPGHHFFGIGLLRGIRLSILLFKPSNASWLTWRRISGPARSSKAIRCIRRCVPSFRCVRFLQALASQLKALEPFSWSDPISSTCICGFLAKLLATWRLSHWMLC